MRFKKSQDIRSFNLNLTSMIDIMAILVFFLIKSFSTEGELVSNSKVAGLELPASTSEINPKVHLNVVISKEAIIVEDEEIEKISGIINSQEVLIASLEKSLKQHSERSKQIAQYNKNVNFKGMVNIQADKSIPFRLLKKVMYTCGQTEYSNISLLVFKDEKF